MKKGRKEIPEEDIKVNLGIWVKKKNKDKIKNVIVWIARMLDT